jgi:hypothetical protein
MPGEVTGLGTGVSFGIATGAGVGVEGATGFGSSGTAGFGSSCTGGGLGGVIGPVLIGTVAGGAGGSLVSIGWLLRGISVVAGIMAPPPEGVGVGGGAMVGAEVTGAL